MGGPGYLGIMPDGADRLGPRVVVNPNHPKVRDPEGRTIRVAFPGHPFVRWLARWLPFDPDIYRERPLMVDAPMFLEDGHTLHCSRAQAAALRRELEGEPQ